MTDLGRAIRVADPVHGYVLLTPIERKLIDTPVAQRLRYIAQSGLAHLVFPEVRTSRFSHSLGAMHLASKFFAASLENADAEAHTAALTALVEAVDGVVGSMSSASIAAEGLAPGCLLAASHLSADESGQQVLLAEQGLRLAALFHDLGHLPFSHDFEYAVEELSKYVDIGSRTRPLLEQREGQDALHERIGHDLAVLLLRTTFDHERDEATRVTFTIAQRILESSEDETTARIRETGGLETAADGAFAWLHTLIAGELDVDRCDYVLRDARNYGFEFGMYDLRRLIDNLTVVADPDAENALVPALRPQAQAAVETFLIARARMYQWGIRHHKVAQIAAALRHGIARVLSAALDAPVIGKQSRMDGFIDDLETLITGASTAHEDLLKRFAGYDDGWWMESMRNAAEHDPQDEWLQLVCWRAAGPRSMWKRAMDFPGQPDALVAFNERLPDRSDVEALEAWDCAVRGLRDDGVIVLRHRFGPWKPSAATKGADRPESALSFLEPNHGLLPVSAVSYPVRALRDAWMNDVQVHAFAESRVQLTPSEVVHRLDPQFEEA